MSPRTAEGVEAEILAAVGKSDKIGDHISECHYFSPKACADFLAKEKVIERQKKECSSFLENLAEFDSKFKEDASGLLAEVTQISGDKSVSLGKKYVGIYETMSAVGYYADKCKQFIDTDTFSHDFSQALGTATAGPNPSQTQGQ